MTRCTIAILLALMATPLAAQPSDADKLEADRIYREAAAQLAAGDAAGALVKLEAADHLYAHPKITVAKATALASLGRPLEAAAAFERALAQPALKPELRQFAETGLAAVDARLAHLTVASTPGASISIDGDAGAPAVTARRLLPGAHTVSVSAPARATRRVTVMLQPAQVQTLTIEPAPPPLRHVAIPSPSVVTAPVPVPRPRAPGPPPRRLVGRWYLWAGAGALVVGVVAITLASGGSSVRHVAGASDLGESPLVFH